MNYSYVNRMPKMGETMMANNFVYSPGGKGANSCVASAKLGSKSSLISKVLDSILLLINQISTRST